VSIPALPCRQEQRGFTLLELLVAIAIFAIVGALALGGLNAVLSQQETARRQLQRLDNLQRAVRLVSSDFSQFTLRPARDALGGFEHPLVSPCGVEHLVCLSHDGWRNPFALFARGEMQRVAYRLEDGKLIRAYWAVMDRTLINEPREESLISGVEGLEIAFLEQGGADWLTTWDPATRPAGGSGRLAAVRLTLQLEDWGEVQRLIEVIG